MVLEEYNIDYFAILVVFERTKIAIKYFYPYLSNHFLKPAFKST